MWGGGGAGGGGGAWVRASVGACGWVVGGVNVDVYVGGCLCMNARVFARMSVCVYMCLHARACL